MRKINLIGVGEVNAQPAANIKKGDMLMWHYGVKATVADIVKQTEKPVMIIERYGDKEYRRTLRKSSLVCIL